MEFHDNDHVYKVIPGILGNKKSEKPAVFHLKGISQDDFNEAVKKEALFRENHTREESSKLIAENSISLVRDRVVEIVGMKCGTHKITNYDELSKHGPREMVAWVIAAVHSTQILTEHEIKN